MTEDKKEQEKPKGAYLQEVVTATDIVMAYNGENVNVLDALAQVINHLKEQTGFELKLPKKE